MDPKRIVPEYVNTVELADYVGISPKTIYNKGHKIKGRSKIGGSVRYHFPTVLYTLQQGKNLFGGK